MVGDGAYESPHVSTKVTSDYTVCKITTRIIVAAAAATATEQQQQCQLFYRKCSTIRSGTQKRCKAIVAFRVNK